MRHTPGMDPLRKPHLKRHDFPRPSTRTETQTTSHASGKEASRTLPPHAKRTNTGHAPIHVLLYNRQPNNVCQLPASCGSCSLKHCWM
jgi:hypothetical protein